MVEKFERESIRTETLTLDKKYEILESMYAFARQMGTIEHETPLDTAAINIDLARILHLHVQKTSY